MSELTPNARGAPRLSLGVAVGLVALLGGIGAFSATQEWLKIVLTDGQVSGDLLASVVGSNPVASSLSWVLLAAWGALLVTRGWVRRTAILVGLLASIGFLVAALRWGLRSEERATRALAQIGVSEFDARLTTWFWLGLITASLNVVLGLVALRVMANWPEMGQRYDAPDGSTKATAAIDLTSAHDVWRAIDEGRDPTVPRDA